MITEQIVAKISLRYLPEDLRAQVWHLAREADLKSLYAVAKLAAARAERRTTQPLLRDARDLPGVCGHMTVLLTLTGDLSVTTQPWQTGSRGRRAQPQPSELTDLAHHSMGKARDRQFLTVDESDSQIGLRGQRCPPHARHPDRTSREPGTVLRIFRNGIKGTRYPGAVQLSDATTRTRGRRDGLRSA